MQRFNGRKTNLVLAHFLQNQYGIRGMSITLALQQDASVSCGLPCDQGVWPACLNRSTLDVSVWSASLSHGRSCEMVAGGWFRVVSVSYCMCCFISPVSWGCFFHLCGRCHQTSSSAHTDSLVFFSMNYTKTLETQWGHYQSDKTTLDYMHALFFCKSFRFR